ncbi:MAG: tRNA pseudouridine(38-40) synthase TruA [Flavobacteriales bacterium]|nr:tRNA pseudouridine(38-40) synthase TruA [Flavobacteriales bacterium]|tara:strand:+ start:158 stop:946 length:789 start_codon:yes stop_codon:yes gene_type:complete
MAKWKKFYLIRIEFLGFRYHGWQKQSGLRSIQGMVDKTFEYIFQHNNFKTLGCGRTDAKVSANDFAFELFTLSDFEFNPETLMCEMNKNLPPDIRTKSIIEVNSEFNIIKNSSVKEYHYYFSSGIKSHPFNAPLIRDFGKKLNIEKMQKAAEMFLGEHNFKRFASKPNRNATFERNILKSEIVSNEKLTANFTPQDSYVFKIKSKGFLRYQVRLMMGALVNVGRGEWNIEQLHEILKNPSGPQVKHIAPSSGLVLHEVCFEN